MGTPGKGFEQRRYVLGKYIANMLTRPLKFAANHIFLLYYYLAEFNITRQIFTTILKKMRKIWRVYTKQ